jgi:hypothetical protein
MCRSAWMVEGVSGGLVARAAETAAESAQPLAKNKYKGPLTKAIIRRKLIALVNG